jgi:hypothetical protein
MAERYTMTRHFDGIVHGAGMVVVAASDYDALAADLVEAKAQRDSWRRIAESGLGITAETNSVPVSSKSAQSGTVSK